MNDDELREIEGGSGIWGRVFRFVYTIVTETDPNVLIVQVQV